MYAVNKKSLSVSIPQLQITPARVSTVNEKKVEIQNKPNIFIYKPVPLIVTSLYSHCTQNVSTDAIDNSA